MEKYVEKIRKLLALAESPNEHEARAALLKAQELMLKHKLTERDIQDAKSTNVVTYETNITFSRRRNPWVSFLSGMIGRNYCCQTIYCHRRGAKTYRVRFIGLEDDAEICGRIFQYTMECILSEIKRIRKDLAIFPFPAEYIRKQCDSYGYGFSNGLKEAFLKQKESHSESTELVLVTPKEVQDAVKDISVFQEKPISEKLFRGSVERGYQDGKEFDPSRRIASPV